MNGLLEHTMEISKTLQELTGSHQGSQSIMSQVAQLNQLTHNKLSSLEASTASTCMCIDVDVDMDTVLFAYRTHQRNLMKRPKKFIK